MKKERRNPLAKERWLEGNRQKWALFLFIVGLLVLGCTVYGKLKDPSPFLGYFTGIGITFILGASADSGNEDL
jgi:polyferredoxin